MERERDGGGSRSAAPLAALLAPSPLLPIQPPLFLRHDPAPSHAYFLAPTAGMPVTSVRELRVLQTCRHPNLVRLQRVVTGPKPDAVFLVFEYCPHDLGR